MCFFSKIGSDLNVPSKVIRVFATSSAHLCPHSFGVLPGLIPPEVVLVQFAMLPVFVRSVSFKSWTIIKLILKSWDFILSFTIVLTINAIVAVGFGGGVKMAGPVFLFMAWLDARLSDARCVFFGKSLIVHNGFLRRAGKKCNKIEALGRRLKASIFFSSICTKK
jgi:hypothetical protein